MPGIEIDAPICFLKSRKIFDSPLANRFSLLRTAPGE
jgi:hypothetical protein